MIPVVKKLHSREVLVLSGALIVVGVGLYFVNPWFLPLFCLFAAVALLEKFPSQVLGVLLALGAINPSLVVTSFQVGIMGGHLKSSGIGWGLDACIAVVIFIHGIFSDGQLSKRIPKFLNQMKYWILLLMWLTLSLVWSKVDLNSFRLLLQYGTSLMFAAAAYANKKQFRVTLIWAVPLAWVSSFVGMHLYLGQQLTDSYGPRVFAIFLLAILVYAVATYRETHGYWYLVWAAAIVLEIIFSHSRTAIAVSLFILLVGMFKNIIWGLCVGLGATLMFVLSVIFIPQIRDALFYGGHLSFASLKSEGRSYWWPLLIHRTLNRPILGFGVGSSDDFVARVTDGVTNQPANDYLRMAYDGGITALVLYMAFLVQNIFGWLRKGALITSRWQSAALLGTLTLAIMGLTDNLVTYVPNFTVVIFSYIAVAVGASREEHDVKYE